MSLSNRARAAIAGAVFALLSVSVLGQALPPGVTPGMLDQLKSMSPAQQQALARQYGISLPAVGASSASTVGLATPGEALPTPAGMTQDDLEAATPIKPKRSSSALGRDTEEHCFLVRCRPLLQPMTLQSPSLTV